MFPLVYCNWFTPVNLNSYPLAVYKNMDAILIFLNTVAKGCTYTYGDINSNMKLLSLNQDGKLVLCFQIQQMQTLFSVFVHFTIKALQYKFRNCLSVVDLIFRLN